MVEFQKSKDFTVIIFEGEAVDQVISCICGSALERGDEVLIIPPKRKSKKKPFWKL